MGFTGVGPVAGFRKRRDGKGKNVAEVPEMVSNRGLTPFFASNVLATMIWERIKSK